MAHSTVDQFLMPLLLVLLDAGHVVCANNDSSSDVDVIWSVLWNGRMAGNERIWEDNQRNTKTNNSIRSRRHTSAAQRGKWD